MKGQFYYLTIILAFAFLPFVSIGQSNFEDVVYLKNGSIIHGVIIEQVPNQSIKIKTKDNNVFVYKIDEIEKMTKEQPSGSGKNKKYVNDGFSLGMKAGLDLSTWSNTDKIINAPAKKVTKPGFQGGFIGKVGFAKYFAFQFEMLLAQKGIKISETEENVTAKVWTTVNYLEIPLLFKASFPVGPVVLYGNVGPAFGIGLTAKLATDPDLGLGQTIKFENGGLQRFDFGLLFGTGVGFHIGNGEIFLDLRYDLGLTDINNVSSDVKKEADYTKNCNRNFGIAFGYLIHLGK